MSTFEINYITPAMQSVLSERIRQISVERFDSYHDDLYVKPELLQAAAAYIGHCLQPENEVPAVWPWHKRWWKPRNTRRDLVRAAALIIAEIDRLDRAKKKSNTESTFICVQCGVVHQL